MHAKVTNAVKFFVESNEGSLATTRFGVRAMLSLVIATGLACTVHFTLRVGSLRQLHEDLRMRVGLFPASDSSMVHVVRAGVPKELIGSGVDDSKIWRFRITLPANYRPCYHSHEGLVRAEAPGGGGGGESRTWGPANPEPSEIFFSVSYVRDNDEWTLSVNHTGGASSHGVPPNFPTVSLDDLIIEEVVDFGGTRSFQPDEPICLLRVREKDEALNRDGTSKEGLYRGSVFYLFDSQYEKAFDAWANGDARFMQEPKK